MAAVFAGGLITIFLARYYHVRASEDLRTETRRLRSIINLLAAGLIDADLFEGKFEPETSDLSHITISKKLVLRW